MRKIIPILMIGALIIAITYMACIDMVPPEQGLESTGNEEGDTIVVLVVNKSIDEWKKLYREYITIKVDRYRKYGWQIEEDLTRLYSIIDNAEQEYTLVVRYAADPVGPGKYVCIKFKLYIPLSAIYLINTSEMLILDNGFYDPFVTELATVINKYIERTQLATDIQSSGKHS